MRRERGSLSSCLIANREANRCYCSSGSPTFPFSRSARVPLTQSTNGFKEILMHRSFICERASAEVSALIIVALCLIGCGGGHESQTITGTNRVTAPVTVHVSPAAADLNPGETRQFTADVGGAANTAVTWSVQEGTAG